MKDFRERKAELLNLTQKAEKMEFVNEDIALKFYEEIFAEYEPNVSKTYDSTIRLLEKKNRLSDALKICNRALNLIKEDSMSETNKDKYIQVKNRLIRKLKDQGVDTTEFDTPKPKNNLKAALLILGIILGLFAILLFGTPYGQILINPAAKDGTISAGGKGSKQENQRNYKITERMIEFAQKNILRNVEVKDVNIIIEENIANINIITKISNEESGKTIIKEYLDYIGAAAASDYSDLSGPKDEKLGEIFDYYELQIKVSTKKMDYLKATKSLSGKKLKYE